MYVVYTGNNEVWVSTPDLEDNMIEDMEENGRDLNEYDRAAVTSDSVYIRLDVNIRV